MDELLTSLSTKVGWLDGSKGSMDMDIQQRLVKGTSQGSWLAGWGMALLLSLLQVMVWLLSMSGTTLGSGWVVLLLLMMLSLPTTAVAVLCRRKPRMQEGFLIGMGVIWVILIAGALLLAFLLGSAYQGLGAP